MTYPSFTYLSTPASFGVRYMRDHLSGWEVAWGRYSDGSPLFSVIFDGRNGPVTTFDAPERFGPRPTNQKQALAFARAFAAHVQKARSTGLREQMDREALGGRSW